jgi:uncharacterized protein (TIGR02421 family)
VSKDRPEGTPITRDFVAEICGRLAEGRRVRRTLLDGGRLHIDRQLPFLCVYRRPADWEDPGTDQLVTGEASFLVVGSRPSARSGVASLVRGIAEVMHARFGAYLVLEIWSERPELDAAGRHGNNSPAGPAKPGFSIRWRGSHRPRTTVDALQKGLRQVRVQRQRAEVHVEDGQAVRPPGMPLPVSASEAARLGCHLIGIEVEPVYRDPATGDVFPATLRLLRRLVSRALEQSFYAFTLAHTTVLPEHYYSLGRRAMVKAVWEVDRRLAEIGDSFDVLLQATPINAAAAWNSFRRNSFQKSPRFEYRPLAVDPGLMKRRLYEIPMERIEDPTLTHLLLQKQDELDRKITLLSDIDTPRFLQGSLQIYGGVEPSLSGLADELLRGISPRRRDGRPGDRQSATEFAARAQAEIDYYRSRYPEFLAQATVRDDLYSGLMVSGGNLLIGREASIPAARVEALLQHEIGTHLLTYYNGCAQPFRQLESGLAGYDVLQEGLAVLAEYLVGGLDAARMRVLAARVAAVQQMLGGATFVDTFRFLHGECGIVQQTAYTITMRVHRGGGLTKDAIYLRGVIEMLDYLQSGGTLEPLWVGKIAADHIPLMRELEHRQILRPPPLRPRFIDTPAAIEKLKRLRQGLTVKDLIDDHSK